MMITVVRIVSKRSTLAKPSHYTLVHLSERSLLLLIGKLLHLFAARLLQLILEYLLHEFRLRHHT